MRTLYFHPVVSSIFFIILLFFPRLISAVGDWMSTIHIPYTWCGLSANLECMSETCRARLAENTVRKKLPLSRHLGTIPQLCQAISSQLRHVSTIGKKLVKQQYLHIYPQYGELRPTSGWDHFVSLGHPCRFQRVSRLGSITARHCSSGCQPNIAALNRGCHLYSAGRPSRWALAHISSCIYVKTGAALVVMNFCGILHKLTCLMFGIYMGLHFESMHCHSIFT